MGNKAGVEKTDLFSCYQTLHENAFLFVYIGVYNAIITAQVISWRSVMRQCGSWLSYNTDTTFYSKAIDYIFRSEGRKIPEKKVCHDRISNSEPPGNESNTPPVKPIVRAHENITKENHFAESLHIKSYSVKRVCKAVSNRISLRRLRRLTRVETFFFFAL